MENISRVPLLPCECLLEVQTKYKRSMKSIVFKTYQHHRHIVIIRINYTFYFAQFYRLFIHFHNCE